MSMTVVVREVFGACAREVLGHMFHKGVRSVKWQGELKWARLL